MISQRDGRKANLPAAEARRSPTVREHDDNSAVDDDGERFQERTTSSARTMTVKCPNPECGMLQTVPKGWAGQKGACPSCESTFYFPTSAASPLAVAGAPAMQQLKWDEPAVNDDTQVTDQRDQRQVKTTPRADQANEPAIVRAGCIGRGNAGKTALFRALSEGTIGDFLPSGLHADAGDPREVAQMIREAAETDRLLHLAGLPPTMSTSRIRYFLFEGAEQRIAFQMHEVIGQVLTHTMPDSTSEQQIRYEEYIRTLVDTQVLWAVVPCPPPNPGSRERRRYANDLRITVAYLREALRLRKADEPVAVALVLSKIDTLFPGPDIARKALADNVLREVLGPLVDLIETSSQVFASAIFPVTAFGFGNAVVNDMARQREGITVADEPFGDEPVWILRDGVDAQPYNLGALFLWTLLFGLQDADAARPEIERIGQMLEDDLSAAEPWLLTIK